MPTVRETGGDVVGFTRLPPDAVASLLAQDPPPFEGLTVLSIASFSAEQRHCLAALAADSVAHADDAGVLTLPAFAIINRRGFLTVHSLLFETEEQFPLVTARQAWYFVLTRLVTERPRGSVLRKAMASLRVTTGAVKRAAVERGGEAKAKLAAWRAHFASRKSTSSDNQ
jgi:hypothetical protein